MTGTTQTAFDGEYTEKSAAFGAEEALDLADKDVREDGMYSAVGDYIDELVEETEKARDTDVFREFLDAQSRFYNYSYRNTLLIRFQRPGARRVAGYNTWQDEFDRHVKKGENAIYIWRPIITTRCPECENAPSYHENIGCEYDDTPREEWDEGLVGFTTCSVFALSQTEGEPVPSLPTDAQMSDDENVPLGAFLDAQGALEASVDVVEPDEWNREGKGVCRLKDASISVLGGRSDAAIAGTLAHEYGHALLHTPDGEAEDQIETAAREVETEAVAYVVGRHFGMDMDGSAFYLASWSEDEPDELRARLKRIANVSKRIIEAIEAEQ